MAPTRPYGAKPGRSPANRSLERGVENLRAFRPGSDLLGNGVIAERTGLSRSTVSRLTQTLVGSGLLQLDMARRAYRLAPAAWQAEVVALATPLTTAEGQFSLNVRVSTIEPIEAVASQLAEPRLALRRDIQRGLPR